MSAQFYNFHLSYGRGMVTVKVDSRTLARAKAGVEDSQLIILSQIEATYSKRYNRTIKLSWQDVRRISTHE